MDDVCQLPDWIMATPLQLPLRYFNRQSAPGYIINLQDDSILYRFGNQLFGWGRIPLAILEAELTGESRLSLWLMAPPEWWDPLATLQLPGGRRLYNAGRQLMFKLNSPVAPMILPSGFFIKQLVDYASEIGALFTLFEQDLDQTASGLSAPQQFAAVQQHGSCWGLFQEQRLLGKLDLLYPVETSCWAGGLVLDRSVRGNKMGRRFLQLLLQHSPFNRLELQVDPSLRNYYVQAGCEPLAYISWYQLVLADTGRSRKR